MTPLKEATIQTISETEVAKVEETLKNVAKQKSKNCFSRNNSISASFPHLLPRTIITLQEKGYKVQRHPGFLGFFASVSVTA